MEGAHVTNTPLVSRVRGSHHLGQYIYVVPTARPTSQLMYPRQTAVALKRIQRFHMSLIVCLLPTQAKRITPISSQSVYSSAAGLMTAYFHQIHSRLKLNTRHSLSHTPPTPFCFTVKNVRMSKAGRYAGHTSPLEDQKFAK